MKGERVFSLDLLRVLACYMVIQVHAGEFYYIGEGNTVINNADASWVGLYNSLFRSAVPLFIMITGYFVLPVKEEMSTFFKRRFTRVVIPFVVWCGLYAVYFFFTGDSTLGEVFINIAKIPVNFGVEVGHLWYIYMLIGLYLFFPIISPWLNSASRNNILFFLVIWAVTLLLPYIHREFPEVLGECFWNPTPLLYYFSGFLGFAVLGCYLKKFHKEKNKWDLTAGVALIVIGYLITYTLFITRLDTEKMVTDLELSWNYGTINVAMMALGIFLVIKNIQFKKNNAFRRRMVSISMMSYGMYLVHIMVLNFFYWAFNDMFSSAAVKIPLMAVCTFIVSYIIIKLISYRSRSKYIIG
ncbi:acyltransferase [Prevotella sp. 10(H)]|uniref:acyltransferase n=1 Tax=Prevotella sp. 10(H) TaxID=1158294 RepID=UPI0004A7028B|nr:acyltransferase [Prevotella sp. 10(H)]